MTKYDFVESLVEGRRKGFFKILEVVTRMFPHAGDAFLIGTAIQVAYQRYSRGATEFCDPYDRTLEAPWKHRAFCMRNKRYDPWQIMSVRDSTAIKNYAQWARDRAYGYDGYPLALNAIRRGRLDENSPEVVGTRMRYDSTPRSGKRVSPTDAKDGRPGG